MPFANTADGGALYWKVEGVEGAPPLVLLNSIGSDMDLWDPLLPALRRRFSLLRIDTRGHGASVATPGDYTLAGLADDVFTVMDQAGFAAAAIAGVSLGGMIAMEAALVRPERVSALALICTSVTMDAASWNDRIALVRGAGMASIADLAMGRFLSPEFAACHADIAATVRRQLLAMDPAGYAGCGAAIRDMALAARLPQIVCPTLVITGARDTSTPRQGHGDFLLQHLPAPEHVELEAAHLAPLEAPASLTLALIDFL
jgi:3-oxoadipate enol-lactonase